MISMVIPLPVGNALKVFLAPPAGARTWRILRKATDDFTDQSDPAAFVAYEGNDKYLVDFAYLQNDVPVFYRAFYWDGVEWSPSATASATPRATYQDRSSDALTILRDRLEAGLAVEVQRGTIGSPNSAIPVLTAPPQYESTTWPMVSIHLSSDAPMERSLGELLEIDSFDVDADTWTESEGWLANVQITVIGWSQNPDERIAMRQALRRIVLANFPVFDAAGLVQIEFQQQDVDAVSGEYPTPVYQTAGTFTCVAPVIVSDEVAPVRDVQVTVLSPN
ncbi:hypothetical protein AWB80_07571 [Caballeronia pedi]|uniref:Uncharacterized protein n=1 Tax=Caballeronia pedi TaxID=1777141 RepID=A0A158DVP6_9BURK|nr:hypothetical protein [Caballeronia pedi]SAK98692.1 hypothetical protein AWB80_07571 [Caballeronia pedi]